MKKYIPLLMSIILASCSPQTNNQNEKKSLETPTSEESAPSNTADDDIIPFEWAEAYLDSVYTCSRMIDAPEKMLLAKSDALTFMDFILHGDLKVEKKTMDLIMEKNMKIQSEFIISGNDKTLCYYLMKAFYPKNHDCGDLCEFFDIYIYRNKGSHNIDSMVVTLPSYCNNKDLQPQFFLRYGNTFEDCDILECGNMLFDESINSWIGRFFGLELNKAFKYELMQIATIERSKESLEFTSIAPSMLSSK